MGFFMREFQFLTLLALGASLAPSVFAESVQLNPTIVQAEQASDPTAPTQAEVRADFAKIPGGAGLVDSESYKSGRSSTPQDIARTVRFLLESPAITGTTLLVDGGQHLQSQPRDVMFMARDNNPSKAP